MNMIIGALIASNFMLWFWAFVYMDLFRRNESMTDTDRLRNTDRYYEVMHEIEKLRKSIEKQWENL